MTFLRRLLAMACAAGLLLPGVALRGADDILDAVDEIDQIAGEAGGDTREGYPVRLVRWDKPDQGLEQEDLYWRATPGSVAAHTFPVSFRLGGNTVIAPRERFLDEANGVFETVYEPFGRVPLTEGPSELRPGNIEIRLDDGTLRSPHPAVAIAGREIRIRCAPVRFDAVDERGVPVPVQVRVSLGQDELLRGPGPFNPLVLWLPVGLGYESSLGSFRVTPEGKVEAGTLRAGVALADNGLRQSVGRSATPAAGAPATTAANRVWLFPHRGRTVFAQGEAAPWFVLLPKGFAGANAEITLDDQPVGTLKVAAAAAAAIWDSRPFLLHTGDLPAGEHQLALRAAGVQCDAVKVTIVPQTRRSSFFVHTMSGCTEAWPTDDAGLALLRDAGIQMATFTGFESGITTRMPVVPPAADPARPPELGLRRSPSDLFLERLLRHRLNFIEMATVREHAFYCESLSYHHSYAPSVERWIRRMSLFAQQVDEYPSWWGINYTWFPKPGGYAESGVPTDAHVHDRNVAAAKTLEARGIAAVPGEERKWYQEHKFSTDPAERARALDIQRRMIAHWKAYNEVTFGEHNALYNNAVRRFRPQTHFALYDNAGHDHWNRARSQFNDMDASCYESYTDYGEWPMSAAFTTEWALGTNPGRPVWLTVDWGIPTEGMAKSLLHAWARGLTAGGCPMQAGAGMRELERRAQILRFLAQYGSVSGHARIDGRVAILSTLSQRLFDGRNVYAYHAIYYHLTRLGFPAVILDEETLLADGQVPDPVQVLFLVRQEQPLADDILKALRAFQARGGRILATGDSTVELENVTKVGGKVNDIWRLSGFEQAVHQDLWREFRDVWRAPLAEALQAAKLEPLVTTDPERGLALAFDVGPVRYVVAIADAYGTYSGSFQVTEELPLSVAGAGWQAVDLVTRQPVAIAPGKGGRTELMVDLVTEPVKVLALTQGEGPAKVLVQTAPGRFRAAVQDKDGKDLGAVPVSFTFVGPDGKERDVLFRTAGEEAAFAVPAFEQPGKWTVRVQELLNGVAVEHGWTHAPPAAPEAVVAVPEVQVPDEARVREFLAAAAGDGCTLVVEPEQPQHLALAERLAAQLTAAGIKARVWQVKPEEYDSIPVRWYPRAEDTARLGLVSEGRLIAWRENLQPFVDMKKGVHIPARGGYAESQPLWMLGTHAVLFPGGRLYDSLRAVTAWMPTPSCPGPGQGRLLALFSPFMANRHVAVLAANDAAGVDQAAARLAEFAAAAKAPRTPPPAVPPPVAWQDATAAPAAAAPGVPTPLLGLAPYRRVRSLAVSTAGHVVLGLAGRRDNVAVVAPDGKTVVSFHLPATDQLAIDSQGYVWAVRIENWTTAVVQQLSADGKLLRQNRIDMGRADMMPPNRSRAASVLPSPDGNRFAAGCFGGILLGDVAAGAWRLYDDVPQAVWRYEVWNPRYPVGLTWSPDGRYLLATMDTRPTGFTNMMGPAFNPVGTETVLLDAQSGERVWSLRERLTADTAKDLDRASQGNSSCAYVVHAGFAALANEARVAAMADYIGQVLLVGRDGNVQFSQKVAPSRLRLREQYPWGPAGGVGTWLSADGSLAAFGFTNRLHLLAGGKLVPVEIQGAALVSGAVAPDGSVAVAAQEDGTVLAFGPGGGEPRWRLDAAGVAPFVAAVPGGFVVANHHGVVVRLDNAGREQWRAETVTAADRERHTAGTEPAAAWPPAVAYREPATLRLAREQLQAREAAAWKPTGGGAQAYGRTFVPVAEPIRLQAADTQDAFLHLVYRRPPENQALTVVVSGKDGTETFTLDLPTPAYRVVDIPVRGPDVTVEVRMTGPVEVAECALYAFAWPSANVAYSADAPGSKEGMTAAATPPKDDDLGLGKELDELTAGIAGDGQSLAGTVKDASIYSWNMDPDGVGGRYFGSGVNPQRMLDGKRFGGGREPAWTTKDAVGPWLTIGFPYAVPLSLVATYDRAVLQSEVSVRLAVFEDFDKADRDAGRTLGGAIDNDQFWRLFSLGGRKVKMLCIHVRNVGGPGHGLTEVEAYTAPEATGVK